jgi:hypothetical protein
MRVEISARGIAADLEPAVGHIPRLMIGGAEVLHAAPWRDDPDIQADRSIPLVDRRLGGSFLAAPFGADDLRGGPPHGASANDRWIVKRQTAQSVQWRLSKAVEGARIDGQIWVRDGEPALYQRHVVSGGTGAVTLAHHPMVHLAEGGFIRCAPKRAVLTEPEPLEPGASCWAPGQRVTDWQIMGPRGAVDLRDYPDNPCEDFLTMVEARTQGLGWTAVHRRGEDDTILFLKRQEELPVTMLWVSNGGRSHSPWNGRHRGVLGVEDGCTAGGAGFAAALGPNRITAEGVPSALGLGGTRVIRHAILRLPGTRAIADVTLAQALQVTYEDGGTQDVPFDREALA